MAIMLHQSDRRGSQSLEHLAASARTFKIGEVLKQTGGHLVLADVTSAGAQTFISAAEQEAKAGDLVAVYRLTDERVYSAPLRADGASLKPGDRVTLSSDRMGITATTAAGVAEIVGMEGNTEGSRVYIRFPR